MAVTARLSTLDRLVELRRQVDVAIAAERRRIATGRPVDRAPYAGLVRTPPARPRAGDQVVVPVALVRPSAIRAWAERAGYRLRRTGPAESHIVADFIRSHQ